MAALLTSLFLVGRAYGACTSNPFTGAYFFPNPDYAKEVNTSIAKHPSEKTVMEIAAQQSAAFWMDTVAHISKANDYLASAQAYAKKNNKATLVTLIVYDVPNRDCSAMASAGEFSCSDENCETGINDYKTKYIAPIKTMLSNYTDPNLRIVLIIEPDSLPNLATNLNVPKCQQAQVAYKTCISYAIKTLSAQSNTCLYIDAAHGGWLGWQNNMDKFAPIINDVITAAGGPSTVRGFADNVANYQWLGSVDSKDDPCNLASQYNFCNNEAVYMKTINQVLENAVSGATFHWVSDSGRNGVKDARTGTQECQQWCNIKGAGLGYKPTTDVEFTGVSDILDALFWLKTPGESDGTTNQTSPYYDSHCSSPESVQPAPNAGDWFDTDFDMLAQNSIWQS